MDPNGLTFDEFFDSYDANDPANQPYNGGGVSPGGVPSWLSGLTGITNAAANVIGATRNNSTNRRVQNGVRGNMAGGISMGPILLIGAAVLAVVLVISFLRK